MPVSLKIRLTTVHTFIYLKESRDGITVIEQIANFLNKLPPHVTVVAAAKTRTPDEVRAAIRAGIKILGYNYVQEAQRMFDAIGNIVQWHMIGHLQRNKVKPAVRLFDMIETIDSVRLAEEVDRRCGEIGKVMPVLIEVNSGREENKAGVFPEAVDELAAQLSAFKNLRLQGLMTMGPILDDPEAYRPYFKTTRQLFERIAELNLPNVEMKFLSMGMSDSYLIAIEEGANMIRIGTKLFGQRR
jgi:pyridoxal phosphate enzyme (YggS family)